MCACANPLCFSPIISTESDEEDWEGETHVSRILREYYEKKRMRLPPWLFDDDNQMKRQPSSRRNREPLAALDPEEQPRASPMRTPSRRRLWEQNPEEQISSRERERQELRQAPIKQPQQPQQPQQQQPQQQQQPEERYYNEYNENSRYSSNDRYANRDYRDDDRYAQRPREEECYNNRNYTEDRYYNNNDNHYEPPRSKDQPRYEQDHRYAQPRARSPPRSQRSNSTSRQHMYDHNNNGYDDRSYYQAPRSERSTRGYSDRYEDNRADLDDYYSDNTRHIPSASRDRAARYHTSPTEPSRREPSIQSGGRRYGNDPGYF